MSQCNYCSFQDYKSRAKKKGEKVTVLADAEWGMGGVNVYSHPKDVNIRKLSGGEDDERAQYRVSWMMELPKTCQC